VTPGGRKLEPPQTVIPRQGLVSGPALALAAAGPGRADLATDIGGVVRAAVSTDHRFSALTSFAAGTVATASVDAAGDALVAFRPAPNAYSAPVSLSRLDAPASQ
jgi:hypothetical protein